MDQIFEAYLGSFSSTTGTRGHMVLLRQLAQECQSVVEIGVCLMHSTYAFLLGLRPGGSLTSIDIVVPPAHRLDLAYRASRAAGIEFRFIHGSDLEVDVPTCKLLFIDARHTYQHVITELRVFQGRVEKYICLHDTSPPFDLVDDSPTTDIRPYPGADRTKQGVWTAVEQFLTECPHWVIKERHYHSHGLTILERR